MADPAANPVLPDAGYAVSLRADLAKLVDFGSRVAAYVDGLDALRDRLPNGTLALVDGLFKPRDRRGPDSTETLAPAYPAPPAQARVMVIETSGELTLSQSNVPTGDHLLVYGDIVTIKGRISLPGRHVAIFARELRTVAVPAGPDGALQPAEIDVSAPEPGPEAPQIVAAAATGRPGTPAKQNTFFSNNGNPKPGSAADELGGAGGRGADGQDGAMGTPGQPGGDIAIVCGRLGAGSTLRLNASGARGGRGRPGQPGGTGGPGGAGANSRDLEAGSAPAFGFLDGSYRYAAALEGGPGGLGGHGGIGGPGGSGGATGNVTVIANQPVADDVVIENRSERGQDGARGEHGAAGPTGAKGGGGDDHRHDRFATGTRVVIAHQAEGAAPLAGGQRLDALQGQGGLPPQLRTPPARWGRHLVIHGAQATASGTMDEHPWSALRGLAQVSHLQQLTEATRLRYLLWDALRMAADPGAPDLDEELGDRLDHLMLGERLLKFVQKHEVVARKGLNATRNWMTLNRARQLDYFGFGPEHVELGPPTMHLRALDQALQTLKEREQAWHAYALALASQAALQDARETAADIAGADLKTARLDLGNLTSALNDVLSRIREADVARAAARQKLRPALVALEGWVRSCIGLTPDDFIDVLFNLAFIGSPITEGPKRSFELAGHGVFTGFTTLTSQTAKLVHKAIDTLPNDEGQPVRREHLLRRIDSFSGRLDDLKEAWTAVNDARRPSDPSMIRLDDEDAYRLLVVQREFDDLLDQFSTKAEARAARTALDAFVASVQQRNELIAEYNALAVEWIEVNGRVQTAQAQLDAVTELQGSAAAPDLASETAFMAALYNRSREWCIEACYVASRAWRFFSLAPDDVLLSVLKLGRPREVNHVMLSAARETLGRKRSEEIRHMQLPHPPHWFPPKSAGPDQPGTYVTLRPDGHGLTLLTVASPASIPAKGQSQVFLAMCEPTRTLHARIFDPRGKCVVDLPDTQWPPSPLIERLKRVYWPERLALDTVEDARQPWVGAALSKVALSMANGLLPPEAPYRLHLTLANSQASLPETGRLLFCIVVGNRNLFLRVFDAEGRMILDRADMTGWGQQPALHGPEIDQLKADLHPLAAQQRPCPTLADERDIESRIERLLGLVPMPAGWTGSLPRVLHFAVMVLSSTDDLPREGRGALFVALVGAVLHLRFFDEQGQALFSVDEASLVQGVHAAHQPPVTGMLLDLKATVFRLLGPLAGHAQNPGALMGRICLLCDLPLHGYALELAAVHDASRLPDKGRGSIIAASVAGKLHVRIFDRGGRLLVDRGGDQLQPHPEQSFLASNLRDARQRTHARRQALTPARTRDLVDTVSTAVGYPLPTCYPQEFETLRRTGSATFTIRAPRPRADLEANAFADQANVRLTRVRAWVHGVRTGNGRCVVQLRHQGTELVCARDGQPSQFVHDPVDTTFDYRCDQVVWGDHDTVVKNPSTLIRRDGDLPVVNDDGTVYPQLVGPFGEWEITLDGPNVDLDRTGIDAIHLEFHGFAQTMARAPKARR